MYSKNIIKKAAGVSRQQYLDLLYDSIITQTQAYGVKSPAQFLGFISQTGAETGGFKWLEELGSGEIYEGRSDLGNTQPGDGERFKGRGLIQLTGRNNYRKAGNFLQSDFEQDPSNVAPQNSTHSANGGTIEQYENAIKSALYFWKRGSAWGNLNNYADLFDMGAPLDLGNLAINALPKSNAQARSAPFNLRPKKGTNDPFTYKGFFLVDYLGLDRRTNGRNLYMLELMSIGVNGGYNGFMHRVERFEAGRQELQNNEYKPPVGSSSVNNTPEPVLEQEVSSNPLAEQNQSRDKKQSGLPNTPGIRIIRKPNININPISYKADGLDSDAIDNTGNTPFVYFNGAQIDIIDEFEMVSNSFLPRIKVTFQDSLGKISSARYPTDDNVVSVLLSSRSPLLRPIFIEFKVITFEKVGPNEFTMTGVMNINEFLISSKESFPNQTSFSVMDKLSKIAGLGYKSNISNTDDKMTWVNTGHEKRTSFIKTLLQHSYISDSGFMWAFVDFYYHLNFIDVETQIQLNVDNQKGILASGIDKISQALGKSKSISTGQIYLTNDQSASATSNFYEDITIFNNSTEISLKQGYLDKLQYYDTIEKTLYGFEVDAIETPGLLPLRTQDDSFFNNNTRTVYSGRLNKRNVHTNYHYAKEQNTQNLDELQKIGLELILPNPNFNLSRFQKIYHLYINQGISIPGYKDLVNKRLSGFYIITEVSFFLDGDVYKQRIRLMRRDLGISEEEVIR